jgi:hypothetical protein
MPDATISRRPTPLLDAVLCLLQHARPAVHQERTFVRLVTLTLGSLVALGRHTLSQVIVGFGAGTVDWTGWYRLFNRERVGIEALQTMVVREVLTEVDPGDPLPVVLDATQLPRSSRRFPGTGWVKAPRTMPWRPGFHRGQRLEILSGLLPRSADGDSRAVPIRSTVLRSAKTLPVGAVPEQSEGQAGIALLGWLRDRLGNEGRADQPVLVLADGAYSTAPVIGQLPANTWLLARCATNRALFALPVHDLHRRGRKRVYGERGPTPQDRLHLAEGWETVPVLVRGRTIPLTVQTTGPWLIKQAPHHPLMLLVVTGIDRGKGTSRRQRDPQYFLVSARQDETGAWGLPFSLAELLAWAWQRWEVEVMHRELKSGFGLGDQQAWSAAGALTTTAWVLWTYALLILAGARCWGLGPAPGPDHGRWWRPRRWSVGRLLGAVRAELWQTGEFQPRWARSPDPFAQITAWTSTQTTAALGIRHY